MSEQKYLRQTAISNLVHEWPKLHMLPQDSEEFQNLVMATCAKHMVSRRTAREYILTAIAKLRIKQANDEVTVNGFQNLD